MILFDKIKDFMYVNEQFLQRGRNEIFSASIVKIRTLNKDVLDLWVDTDKSCSQDGLHLTTDKNVCIA